MIHVTLDLVVNKMFLWLVQLGEATCTRMQHRAPPGPWRTWPSLRGPPGRAWAPTNMIFMMRLNNFMLKNDSYYNTEINTIQIQQTMQTHPKNKITQTKQIPQHTIFQDPGP